MRLAGNIQRHDDLAAHKLLPWEPSHGTRGRGRPPLTFVDNLRSDTGLKNTGEIKKLIAYRQKALETHYRDSDSEAAIGQVSQVNSFSEI